MAARALLTPQAILRSTKTLLRSSSFPKSLPTLWTARMSSINGGLDKYPGRTNTLNTGQVLPAIGLGTFQDPDEQENSVYTALKCGYRHIDTAHKFVPHSPIDQSWRYY